MNRLHSYLISVIMPVYNSEKFVAHSLKSIISQSYRNIEIIVLDDGSRDKSSEIISTLAKKDNRIKFISRENRGLICTLNEMISIASGQFIARMDSDDVCDTDRLKQQLEYCLENDLDICGCNVRTFGRTIPRTICYPAGNEECYRQLSFATCFAHPTVFARSHILKENIYLNDYKHAEDYELWTRLAIQGVRMGNVQKTLLYYRKSIQQVSNRHSVEQLNCSTKISLNYINIGGSDLREEERKLIATYLTNGKRIDKDLYVFFNKFRSELRRPFGDYVAKQIITRNASLKVIELRFLYKSIGVKWAVMYLVSRIVMPLKILTL